MKPTKLCPDCKETKICFRLFSSKVNRSFDNFCKDFSKENAEKFSIFNAKVTLNNAPCKFECGGSQSTIIRGLIALIAKNQILVINYF